MKLIFLIAFFVLFLSELQTSENSSFNTASVGQMLIVGTVLLNMIVMCSFFPEILNGNDIQHYF